MPLDAPGERAWSPGGAWSPEGRGVPEGRGLPGGVASQKALAEGSPSSQRCSDAPLPLTGPGQRSCGPCAAALAEQGPVGRARGEGQRGGRGSMARSDRALSLALGRSHSCTDVRRSCRCLTGSRDWWPVTDWGALTPHRTFTWLRELADPSSWLCHPSVPGRPPHLGRRGPRRPRGEVSPAARTRWPGGGGASGAAVRAVTGPGDAAGRPRFSHEGGKTPSAGPETGRAQGSAA